jgi:rhamnose transport system ATP-binding protein
VIDDGPAPGAIGVAARDIVKSFGGAQALTGVSVEIRPGTVHALVGENGAGKSTLGKVLAGVVRPDAGEVLVDGQPVGFRSPHDALAVGVTMIAQELALEPRRSVIDNIYLGIEPVRFGFTDRGRLDRDYEALSRHIGFELPGRALVGTLRVADQQKVEILRALARKARVIVMDEPTAALSADEAARLTTTVRALRDSGTTIIYVSHFLEEVLRVADDITVLRNGEVVRSGSAAEVTKADLVTAMLGRPFDLAFPPKVYPPRDAPLVLRVSGLAQGDVLRGIDLEVRAGEILGLAGLIGSGRTELVRCIYGADRFDQGELVLDGKPFRPRSPREAVTAGIGMIPESRKDQGLLMRRSVLENLTLPHVQRFVRIRPFVSPAAERSAGEEAARSTGVRAPSLSSPVGVLSGGNQQKVLFGRWLIDRPRLLIADEPTRGVDVGAKIAIYDLVADIAAAGSAVIVVSSELEEVLGLAHRVLVLNSGSIVGRFDGPSFSMQAVMHAAFTTASEAPAA